MPAHLDHFVLEGKRLTREGELNVHIVDCDLDPLTNRRFSIKGNGAKHRRMGKIALQLRNDRLYGDGREIVLYSPPGPRDSSIQATRKLYEEIQGKSALNACLAHYLGNHIELVPKSWLRDATNMLQVYFWGTIFRGSPDDYGWPPECALYVAELNISYGLRYDSGSNEVCWSAEVQMRNPFEGGNIFHPVAIWSV